MTDKYASALLKYLKGKKPALDPHDVQFLQAKVGVRRKSFIDSDGQITPLGVVKILSKVLMIRFLDVLALAFVASASATAARETYEEAALEFDVEKPSIQKAFGNLVKKKLIIRCGPGVYKLSGIGDSILESYKPVLYQINWQRDDLLKNRPTIRR